MRFSIPRRRIPGENIVPMINVVFLLLIFFLMSARIAPSDPFAVTPPASTGYSSTQAASVLYIDAGGTLAFGAARGEDVWSALATAPGPLLVRADAGLAATRLAGVLARLASAGVQDVRLITVRP